MSLDTPSNKTAVVVSVNPNSGSSDQSQLIALVKEKLEHAGFEPLVLSNIAEVAAESKRLNDAENLRGRCRSGGRRDCFAACQYNEQNIPLAILPMGTENLLAKYLNLNADPDRLLQLLQNGVEKKLDAGRANGKLFLVMASCGFDASVVEKLHSSRKGHISHLSYFRPILSSIRRYRYPAALTITIEDDSRLR